MNNLIRQNMDIVSVFAVAAGVLMIPLVAMRFTNEVDWTLLDFSIMGTLIVTIGLLIVLALRKIKNTNYRIAVVVALLAIFFLIWAELAVGIFNTPFAGS